MYTKIEGVPYIRVAGTTYRFEPKQSDTILLNFEFNGMDMDPDMSRSDGSKNRDKDPAQIGPDKLVTRGVES